jgi:hypothetical protein
MLFEAKFEAAYRLVFGTKIEVEDEKDCARNSKGTYLNLVIIDEL